MAFVLQFAPQDFVNIPKRGTIQYHPSLLPSTVARRRSTGRSSAATPRPGSRSSGPPTAGRGPVILQKETPIGPDDTLGTVYFDRLFPMGVKAMLEAADLVASSRHKEACRTNRRRRTRLVPQAGSAHQLGEPRRLRLQRDPRLQSRAGRLVHARGQGAADLRRAQARGAHLRRGEGQDRRSRRGDRQVFSVTAQGGRIEVLRAKLGDGKKARRLNCLPRGRSRRGKSSAKSLTLLALGCNNAPGLAGGAVLNQVCRRWLRELMDLSQSLEIATCTDPGMVRSHNEDSIAADSANGLVVLADGMGGYNAGEVASGMATTVIITEMRQILTHAKPYDVDSRTRKSLRACCASRSSRRTARSTRRRKASRSMPAWAPRWSYASSTTTACWSRISAIRGCTCCATATSAR